MYIGQAMADAEARIFDKTKRRQAAADHDEVTIRPSSRLNPPPTKAHLGRSQL
jgi:hypothetical protein